MIRARRLGVAALAAAGLTAPGCGLFSKGPPEPPKPLVYSLCLKADPKVNWYNDTANTLYVRLYQLSTPDAFLQTDPARMVDPAFTLNGAVAPPLEKTLFPGSKTTVDVRQNPDATVLGIVGFYYQAAGPVKARRPLPQRGDPPPKTPPGCIVFGQNGIDSQ
jgi:type VI secretion system VasD/TssJ family lipoprotein